MGNFGKRLKKLIKIKSSNDSSGQNSSTSIIVNNEDKNESVNSKTQSSQLVENNDLASTCNSNENKTRQRISLFQNISVVDQSQNFNDVVNIVFAARKMPLKITNLRQFNTLSNIGRPKLSTIQESIEEDAELLKERAQQMLCENQFDASIELYQKIINFEEANQNNPKRLGFYWSVIAECHYNSQRYSEALTAASKAIEFDASESLYFFRRASIYAKLDNSNEATKDLFEMLELNLEGAISARLISALVTALDI